MNDASKKPVSPALDDLDATDRRILDLLQQDGRMTNAALAEAVGLTATPMLQRMRKLEQRGIIRGYTAIVDPTALGRSLLAFVWVRMSNHNPGVHERFVEMISGFQEVLECHHISGEEDYLLKVLVRDMREYEGFLLHRINQISDIARVKTTFVLSSPKMATAIPVGDDVTNGGTEQ
jgi:Lrp/AsnC family transcriptional regulator, leucine-responsive regulatory protein